MTFPVRNPAALPGLARISKNAFWILLSGFAAQAATLAASVIASRLLGRNAFGSLGAIQSTVLMLGTFAGLGMGITATRHVALYRERDPAEAGRVLSTVLATALLSGAAVSLLLLLARVPLAEVMLGDRQAAASLGASSALLFLSVVNGAQAGALAGFEAYREMALSNLLRGGLLLALTPPLARVAGVPGTLWALSAGTAAACLYTQIVLGRHRRRCGISGTLAGLRPAWRTLAGFSVPAVLASALVAPVNWLVNLALLTQPGGLSEMAIWTVAFQWRNLLIFVPTFAGQLLVPALASGSRDRSQAPAAILFGVLALSLGAGLATGLAVFAAAEPILASYGPGFAGRGSVVRIVALTGAMLSVTLPLGNVIIAAGKMWLSLVMNLVWAAALLVSLRPLLEAGLGAGGVAVAHLIAYSLQTGWMLWVVWRLFGKGLRNASLQPSFS